MWKILFAILLVAGAVIAQEPCHTDADCPANHYCYNASDLCAPYTNCSRYNRRESTKPSRQPNQCGTCLTGYSEEAIPDSSTGVSESCTKNTDAGKSDKSSFTAWKIVLTIIIPIILGVVIIAGIFYLIARSKFCKPPYTCDRRNDSVISSSATCIPIDSLPTAPPLQLGWSQNNNKYDEAEETNPLTSTERECRGHVARDMSHPVKAQGYHNPNWVNTDPNYNPGSDTQTTPVAFSLTDNDDETMSSDWTPGQSGANQVIPIRPFSGITEEQRDNTTNAGLARVACPSPSINDDSSERGRNNSTSSNSGTFRSNDTNGNTHGNSNSAMINIQLQMNVINQNGNGS